MPYKPLILGQGYISQRLQEELGYPALSKRITAYADIDGLLKQYKPKVLINAIGHIGKSNVDHCELDIHHTLQANTFVPIMLAEACFRHKVKLVHISSGCIYHYDYDKQRPLAENKVPDYYHLYYSRTKIYAENVLTQSAKQQNILIARIRIPLDDRPHPKNILNKLIQYKKVIDVPNAVTYIPDFARAIKHLIRINARGCYNTTCKGGLRYPDLLNEYQKHVPDFRYKTISLKSLGLNRTNMLLSTKKLEQSGFKIRTVKEIIQPCVKNYVQSL